MKKLEFESKSWTKVLVSICAIASISTGISSVGEIAHAAPKTTFACIRQGEVYVTVARRANRQTSPMITWKDTSFGKYTPESRCRIVSERLTRAVSYSGKLNNLTMTSGMVNSVPVICYITKTDEKCNSKNLLFSLKPSERGQEKKILAQLLSFSINGTGSPLNESSQVSVSLENWIESELKTPIETQNPSDDSAQPR